MSILRYKNSNGQWTELPLLEGPPGMSAYEHAVAGGYDGTIEEFEEQLNAIVNIDEAEELEIDGNPIENSNNLITSGGVYSALNGKVDKVSGKGLSTNDYDTTAKAKVDAIPSTPKYTDTIYDDTAIKSRVSTIENKEAGWDAKQDAIPDLATIRSGAAKGATSVQPESGKGLFSGNYNDLTNKPTIPSAVTESTVSGWGFTKNTGTYSKPSSGIPKTDLASAVQTSLGKADSALQAVDINGYATEQYVNNHHDDTKQDTLTAGENISIVDNVISATGGEDNVFDVLYSATSFASIKAASDAGKICRMKISSRIYYLSVINAYTAYFVLNAAGTERSVVTCGSNDEWSRETNDPVQTQSISDTGNYFSADTVEGALQELGAAKLNPTSKTSAMTQEVGKDSNGKLWTTPGGGDSGGSSDVFRVYYGTTPFAEAYDALQTGKICYFDYIGEIFYASRYAPNTIYFTHMYRGGTKLWTACQLNGGWTEIYDDDLVSDSRVKASITSSSTDNDIPSAKAVYDFVMSLDSSEVLY